jgi:tetratricopeptide (TPR) repeat protein
MRPETHRPVWKMKAQAQERYADFSTEIRLGPLEAPDSARLIHSFMSQSDGEHIFHQRILERAEGNPLFVEEMVRSLIDRELLIPCGNGDAFCWKPAPDADLATVAVPESLHALFQERVDRLGADARRVLQQASVIGRTFYRSILAELSDADDTLDASLDVLSRADLIRESARTPELQYAFRHPLILESVYDTIPRRRRQEFHRRVGEAIERLFAARLDERAGRIGHHYYEAADERALGWLLRAAEQAQRVYEPNAVLDVLQRAQDLAARLELPTPPEACLLRGHAHEMTGNYDAARDDFHHALNIARASGDTRSEWEALIGLGMAWAERDYAQAGESFQAALAIARRLGDDEMLGRSLNRLGNWYSNLELPEKGIELHSEALEIFHRLKSDAGIAETLDLLGIAQFLVGDLIAGTHAYDEAIALFTRLGDRRGLASSLAMRVLASGSAQSVTINTPAVSLDALTADGMRALEITREIGWQAAEAFTLFCLASATHVRGEFDRALSYATQAKQVAESIEHRQWTLASHVALGAIHLDLLLPEVAREHFTTALALAEEIGSAHWRRTSSAFLACSLVVLGERERAGQLLDAVLGEGAQPRSLAQREARHHRAVLHLANGEADNALAVLADLVQTAPGERPEPTVDILLLKGRALTALGRHAEAEEALLASQKRAVTLGFLPAQQQIALALAALYAAQGRADAATEARASAHTLTAALAATIIDEQERARYLARVENTVPT